MKRTEYFIRFREDLEFLIHLTKKIELQLLRIDLLLSNVYEN